MKTKSNLRYQKSKVIAKNKREPIKEARRYVDNAREILAERGKLDDKGVLYSEVALLAECGL